MEDEIVYPVWHDKPFRLTVNEITNPMQVLEDFFFFYPLPEVRKLLWGWLSDALHNSEVNAGAVITLFENLDRLIEAVHLINQRNAKSSL